MIAGASCTITAAKPRIVGDERSRAAAEAESLLASLRSGGAPRSTTSRPAAAAGSSSTSSSRAGPPVVPKDGGAGGAGGRPREPPPEVAEALEEEEGRQQRRKGETYHLPPGRKRKPPPPEPERLLRGEAARPPEPTTLPHATFGPKAPHEPLKPAPHPVALGERHPPLPPHAVPSRLHDETHFDPNDLARDVQRARLLWDGR